MKKETLEEATLKYKEKPQYFGRQSGFIKGAKWQKQRSYSEDEVLKLLLNIKRVNIYYEDVEKWFEQFKKKQL